MHCLLSTRCAVWAQHLQPQDQTENSHMQAHTRTTGQTFPSPAPFLSSARSGLSCSEAPNLFSAPLRCPVLPAIPKRLEPLLLTQIRIQWLHTARRPPPQDRVSRSLQPRVLNLWQDVGHPLQSLSLATPPPGGAPVPSSAEQATHSPLAVVICSSVQHCT